MLSAKNVLSLVVKVVEVLIARLAIEIILCTELHETTNSSLVQTSFSAYIKLVQFNGPYAWLRQTSKFHHQASSARKILCICTLFAWIFFSNLLPWDILLCKTSQLYNSKRGLVEKFAHLTQTCIRAISVSVTLFYRRHDKKVSGFWMFRFNEVTYK